MSNHGISMEQEHTAPIEEKSTTIKVRVSTRERLRKYGTLGDTFDSVINKILNQVENL